MNKTFGVTTYIGKRPENQDGFFANGKTKLDDNYISGSFNPDEINVFAVFDGMGGMNFGGRASQIAGEIFKCEYNKMKETAIDQFSKDQAIEWLKTVSDKIRDEIYENLLGSGTTLTACIIYKGNYVLFNVGDSPAFLYDGENATEIGERQNFYGFTNLITHCVGNHELPSEVGYVSSGTLPPNSKLVLCSDGISEFFTDTKALCKSANIDNIKNMAIEAGNAHSFADNCTLLIVNF